MTSIIVGTDFSQGSYVALEIAVDIAIDRVSDTKHHKTSVFQFKCI